MKQFLLFAGSTYYPSGGWQDFQGDFLTEKEALIYITTHRNDWFHIIDSHTLTTAVSG